MNMNKRDEFHTAAGRLSKYALACGYVESAWEGQTHIELWLEHGVYNVRAHDHDKECRVMWGGWHTVTEARREFDRMVRSAR